MPIRNVLPRPASFHFFLFLYFTLYTGGDVVAKWSDYQTTTDGGDLNLGSSRDVLVEWWQGVLAKCCIRTFTIRKTLFFKESFLYRRVSLTQAGINPKVDPYIPQYLFLSRR